MTLAPNTARVMFLSGQDNLVPAIVSMKTKNLKALGFVLLAVTVFMVLKGFSMVVLERECVKACGEHNKEAVFVWGSCDCV